MIEDTTRDPYGLSGISRLVLDLVEPCCEVHITDGPIIRMAMPFPFNESTNVLRASFDLGKNALTLDLVRGDVVTIELDWPGKASDTHGRPIVYLDQCHWSALANHLYDPPRIAAENRAPAARLIQIARENKIVLPLSSAHMNETTVLYNVKRQNLAATMLELSRGWQMRGPITVRLNEIADVVGRRYQNRVTTPLPVFTLEPNAVWAKRLDGSTGSYSPSRDFPPAIRHLLSSVTAAAALYDILIDSSRIEPNRPTAWVEHKRRVMQDMRQQDFTRQRRREIGIGLAVIDAAEDIEVVMASLDLNEHQVREWCNTHYKVDLDLMPFFSLYADITEFRLSALNTNWQEGDFFDMLFLSCAAAYADVVVAEGGATEYIRRSWRSRSGISPVVKTLAEAVERIERLLS